MRNEPDFLEYLCDSRCKLHINWIHAGRMYLALYLIWIIDYGGGEIDDLILIGSRVFWELLGSACCGRAFTSRLTWEIQLMLYENDRRSGRGVVGRASTFYMIPAIEHESDNAMRQHFTLNRIPY